MKKYAAIAKIYLKMRLTWRVDALVNVLFTVMKILFAYLLWGILFQNKSEIAGFSFNSMLSYYVISAMLNQLEVSSMISWEMEERIRNGTFSKYMVLPINIQRYFGAMETGVVLFYVGFDVVASLIWIAVFRIRFVITTQVCVIECALIIFLLGLVFMNQLNYYLGLLTLKYQDIGTFLMIKSNIMAFITGTIVPLALFPEKVIIAMRFLPFYYVTYLPAMLFTGRCQNEALTGILILLCWCGIMQVVIGVTWKLYRRKYDGVGI